MEKLTNSEERVITGEWMQRSPGKQVLIYFHCILKYNCSPWEAVLKEKSSSGKWQVLSEITLRAQINLYEKR